MSDHGSNSCSVLEFAVLARVNDLFTEMVGIARALHSRRSRNGMQKRSSNGRLVNRAACDVVLGKAWR